MCTQTSKIHVCTSSIQDTCCSDDVIDGDHNGDRNGDQITGANPGGGGSLGSGLPPFGGPQNFKKRKKTSRANTQLRHVLVLNS